MVQRFRSKLKFLVTGVVAEIVAEIVDNGKGLILSRQLLVSARAIACTANCTVRRIQWANNSNSKTHTHTPFFKKNNECMHMYTQTTHIKHTGTILPRPNVYALFVCARACVCENTPTDHA